MTDINKDSVENQLRKLHDDMLAGQKLRTRQVFGEFLVGKDGACALGCVLAGIADRDPNVKLEGLDKGALYINTLVKEHPILVSAFNIYDEAYDSAYYWPLQDIIFEWNDDSNIPVDEIAEKLLQLKQ